MYKKYCAAIAALTLATVPSVSFAVEGGIGAYFLGSRDSFAGIVPGPGTYVGTDFIHFNGTVDDVSIGGLPVIQAEIDTFLFKLSMTQVFETTFLGGTPALNINIPYASADMTFTGPFADGITDDEAGFGDPVITPMIGWHRGKLHYSAGASIFFPLGKYDTATVDIPAREIDVLSIGKNVWAIQPVVSATYFDTDTGLEVSGAASVLISEFNDATDYQSAPQFTLEAAVLQHLPSGLAFGVNGYAYKQFSNDSGEGASNTELFTGAESLAASVFGAGPIVTYSSEVFGQQMSFKLKYTKEFNARRRFENDVLWLNLAVTF